MICRSCADIIEDTLFSTRGVISAHVNYFKGMALVEYDPDIITLSGIEAAIEKSGYPAGDNAGINGLLVDIICLLVTSALVFLLLQIKSNPAELITSGSSYFLIFLTGLLTSTHCVAMCGGIMLSQNGGNSPFKRSLLYNSGRALSYTILGFIFGALGTVITYSLKTKSIIFTLAGVLVVFNGLKMWGAFKGFDFLAVSQINPCELVTGIKKNHINSKPFIIGVLTGLMPCAPLYSMWLCAMGCGSPFKGAAIMLVFSLGTLPLMFILGSLKALIPAKYSKYMLRGGAILILAMGIGMMIKGLRLM